MTLRIQDQNIIGNLYARIAPFNAYIENETNLDPKLTELVKMRVSQINGCAYCTALHTEAALNGGERLDRLTVLSAWHEAPDWFTDRERAALLWAETLTTISDSDVNDDLYALVRKEFSEKDLADLTLVVITINGTNRMATPFRAPLSHFEVPTPAAIAD